MRVWDTNFPHFPHSHFQAGKDENPLSILGVKLGEAEQFCRCQSWEQRNQPCISLPTALEKSSHFPPSSPEAKSTNIRAVYTALLKPCW